MVEKKANIGDKVKKFRDEKGLSLEDLGSTNGTYLNGRKVGGPARLKKGDRIKVGPIELEVLA